MPDEEENLGCCGKVWKYRTLICFWILGLANNYGYVVMLSAAHDILEQFDVDDEAEKEEYKRDCNTLSTGIILLADIIPTIIVKIVAPFVPFYIYFRMAFAVALSAAGFILVAVRLSKILVILGVVCMSFSCGLGEATLLAYMVFFKTINVLSTWSSGTGGAGIFGSTSYAALIAIGLTPVMTLLVMLVVPTLQAITFYLVIEHPKVDKDATGDTEGGVPNQTDVMTFKEKMKVLPQLLITYMIPFGMVYLFEYFINQALFELLYFPKAFLDHQSQYRWYSVLYQVGVFISRSSMNIVHIDFLWTLAIVQGVNVTLAIIEVFVGFVTFLPIMMIFIVWEGLIGGSSYVNTYRKIVTEMPPDERQYCMAMNSFGDAIMITMAGVLAQPTHNWICKSFDPQYSY